MGTGSSLSRTGISVGAGASSRLGGVFARLWLGLIVLLFGSIAELVPLSVIAGMLFVIGAELIVGRLLHLVPTKDGKFEESAVPEVYPVNQVTVLVFEGNIFFAKFPLYD